MPIVSAVVAGLILGPVEGRLHARGLPHGAAASLIVLCLLAALGGAVVLLAGSFTVWADDLPRFGRALTELTAELGHLAGTLREAGEAVEDATGLDPAEGGTGQLSGAVAAILGGLAAQTPVVLGQLVLFFALLFFLLAGRMRLRNGLLRLCMTRRARLRAARIFRDAETKVSRYLLTITAINLVLGVVTALVMAAIGLPNPVLWGALAFAVNFAPYLGPTLLTVLLLGAGLISFDTLAWAVAPAAAFLLLNLIEAYFVTPTILGRSLRLEPALLLIALVLLFGLWGMTGAVLAVPLVMILQVALDHLLPHQALPARAARPLPAASR